MKSGPFEGGLGCEVAIVLDLSQEKTIARTWEAATRTGQGSFLQNNAPDFSRYISASIEPGQPELVRQPDHKDMP